MKPRVVGLGRALLAMVPRSPEPAYTDLGLRRLYSILRLAYCTVTPPMQLMRTVTEPRGANATSRLCLNVSGDRDVDVNPNKGYSHRPAWGCDLYSPPINVHMSHV